ncbi:hypothetical protein GIB67_030800 [Kingdonia uniflora]|uniref:RNase H type-1 domain-containing protein n=1 Tax=Kingdonia uniflora TaxID=39325 RepID=A0A7J7L313_9MAGN|nr:hypothetical protein GIB67_030800 [Kingdonia uniflora]
MDNTVHDLKIIKALNVHCKSHKGVDTKCCRWILPSVNEIKVCCDGFPLDNPGLAGIGIIYKNSSGAVMGTFSKAIGHSTNYIAEIKAIISGVQKVMAKGWRKVWVVSDSAAAIKVVITDKNN